MLACDGDSQNLRALRVVLRGAGFSVDETTTAGDALGRAALRAPDAAIIELALPDGDGVELGRRLRDSGPVAVILLSAVDEQEQKVRALDAGVDDYITKPFDPLELVARLRAVLRRAQLVDGGPIVELGGLEINLASHEVRRDGREVHLTPIEFKLLRLLVRNRGRLLTHDALLRQVWGSAYVGETATLRTHIANLRHKIEAADDLRRLTTCHGVGYRLAA